MKVDLHVHSRFSRRPSVWVLQKLGCAESYTEPRDLYRIAMDRGMDAVTITDHNAIAGCLEIADLPNTFVGCEITTYFPEDRCKLHVLAYRISEKQFKEIDSLRENVFELIPYLAQEKIMHSLAHPLGAVNDRMTVEHFEQCLLLFRHFELNRNQDATVNHTLQHVLTQLTPADIEQLVDIHGIDPWFDKPWNKGLTGGSDDHSSVNIAHTYTEIAGARSVDEFCAGLAENQGRVGFQRPCTPLTMAHHLYGVAYQFYNSKLNLDRYYEHNILMRFLDRMLQIRERREPRLWARLYSRMRSTVKPTRTPADRASMMERIQYEAQKLVTKDPQLRVVLNQGLAFSPEPDQHWFRFVNKISNNILGQLSRQTGKRVFNGNPFDIFHTIGSAGALYTLIAPYFVAYNVYSKGRRLSEMVGERFAAEIPPHTRPRVGLFTDTFEEVNGVAHTLNRQVKLAQNTGKDLTIVTCTTDDSKEPYTHGVRYFQPVEILETPEYPEQKICIPPLLEIMHFCYEQKFTHIHAATPGPLGLAALAVARIMKLPFITTYHTAIPQYAMHLTDDLSIEELMWSGILWFYDQSDFIFSPSQATAQELIDRGIPSEKIQIMPRGVDIERFNPMNECTGIDLPEGTRFLYVGRVSKEKNLPLLCRAFKRLSETCSDVHLIVVGDGPYLKEMKRSMNGASVHFTGYLDGDELAGIYPACDTFVFPSTTDTFGNVVLEAQAGGVPIIVTDLGGPQENLIPNETGLIVQGENEDALVEAMKTMATNSERRRQMGIRARQYAEKRSFLKAFDAYWEIYRERSDSSKAREFTPFPAHIPIPEAQTVVA